MIGARARARVCVCVCIIYCCLLGDNDRLQYLLIDQSWSFQVNGDIL